MGCKRYLKELDNLSGKTVVITGANSGIGFEACKHFLYKDCRIIMACRNYHKAIDAKYILKKKFPKSSVEILLVDISEEKNIDNFICDLKKHHIDIVVCNAGVYHVSDETNSRGQEIHFATNFIGTSYLIERLNKEFINLEIVLVSSIVALHSKIKYKDVQSLKSKSYFKIYGRSKKLALLQAEYEADLIDNKNRLHVCHPGITHTSLFNKKKTIVSGLLKIMMKIIFISQKKASMSILACLNTRSDQITGPKIFNIWGYPKTKSLKKKILNKKNQQKAHNIYEEYKNKM